MSCHICGRASGATTPPCPHCPDAKLPVTQNSETTAREAVDPEVLGPGEAEHSDSTQGFFRNAGSAQGANGNAFRFISWQSYTNYKGQSGQSGQGTQAGPGTFAGGMARDSCLPGIITMFLALTCAVQFGVLAGLGFFIFTLIGSAFTLVGDLRMVMQGRKVYPWLGRVLVWAGSWLLAGWLSGGL